MGECMIALKQAVPFRDVKRRSGRICIAGHGLLVCLCSAVVAQETQTLLPAQMAGQEMNPTQPGIQREQVLAGSQAVQRTPATLDEVRANHARVTEITAPSQEGTVAAPRGAAQEGLVLRRGLREREFSVGYGFKLNVDLLDERTGVSFLTIIPRFGKFQTARREILLEFPFTVFTQPDTRFAVGATAMLRQHFRRRGKWVPFAEAGSGFVFTNLRIPELSGSFQFSPQIGLGIRYSRSATSSLTIAARWYHLSNAGLRKPNIGLNTGLVTVGYSRFF
jgi:hypothetical protein